MFQTPIFIPSRSRVKSLSMGTLSRLPRALDEHIIFVVPSEQVREYERGLLTVDRPNIEVLDCPRQGISDTRKFIAEIAYMRFHDKFIMCDDDLTSWSVRISDDDYHLRKATDEDKIEAFTWLQTALNTYAHASLCPRGNNLKPTPKGILVGPKPLALENQRLLRVYAYQTDKFLELEHNRIAVMDDFDFTLQLLRKGYKNVQSYWWTQDQRQTGSPGGCADYRSHEVHEQSARKLAEFHPGFVTLKEKTYIYKAQYNKEFAGKRMEVIIFWKKAWESSQK